MKFKEAQIIINCALLYGKLSLLVIGRNGIGKTEMVVAMSRTFKKKSVVINDVDMGGLDIALPVMAKDKVRTITFSDIQNILKRKGSVRTSTINTISSIASEGLGNNFTYASLKNTQTSTTEDNYKFNFVIAGTNKHLIELHMNGFLDLLDRFIIIEVDRSDFKKEGFSLDIKPYKKYNKDIYSRYKNVKFVGMSPRKNVISNELIRELEAVGIEPMPFLKANSIEFYDTTIANIHANVSGILQKPTFEVEEEDNNETEV